VDLRGLRRLGEEGVFKKEVIDWTGTESGIEKLIRMTWWEGRDSEGFSAKEML